MAIEKVIMLAIAIVVVGFLSQYGGVLIDQLDNVTQATDQNIDDVQSKTPTSLD